MKNYNIYIISCIKNLNNGLYKKLIIYKDATASGIQLLTTILGANNQEILKNCNLNSNNIWYDTYSYVINLFIKKHNNELKNITNNNYNKYLKRSFLKKSIMTYVYDASKETTLYCYLENLSNDLDKKITKEIFFMFYDFLNTLFFSTNFFNEPPINIIDNAKKEYKINKKIYLKTIDNALIALTYYKINYYRLNRIIENNRSTISFYIKSSAFDKVKTYRALLANVTQSLNALFLRLIILEMDRYIITIHNSFGIDILNIDKLIKIANIAINKICFDFNINANIKNKNKKFFSVFILI